MMAKSAAAAAARKGRSLPMSKRRGRPPRPPATAPPRRTAEDRRNLRPRRRRPLLDDYSGLSSSSDEEEEEVEEKERRKLKLVLKLPPLPARREEAAPISRHRKLISGRHVSDSYPLSPSSSSSSSYVEDEEEEDENREEVEEEEEEEAIKPPKKRRIDSSDERIGAHGSRSRETGKTNLIPRLKVEGVISGLSAKSVKRTPLPDRKALEAILDKLQKKDTYRVFAQPVDPEELPDYHHVIEHPMDFGTVRKKLGRNVYRSFEQFEDDVFLICSNAMQYNAPDTVYFRQARSIQDMAREKFQKLRDDQKTDDQKLRDNGMFSEIEGKSEENLEKIRISSLEKQPLKTSISRTGQEPLGSDISSATTLGSTGEAVTGLSTTKANATEPPIAVNGSVDKSCSLGGSKSEKADELSARSFPIELLRKSPVVDENRRATYNISEQQPSMESDPVFDIFESEPKQLVDVGLQAEHSYARSLACFAATLGPMAWKIAAENIEKALPAGIKFGPGWVGEYEPLPTAVLSLENHSQHQLGYNSNLHNKAAPKRVTGVRERPKAAANGNSEDIHLGLRSGVTTNSTRVPNPMKKNCHGDTGEMKQRVSGFTAEHHPTSDNIRLHKKNEQVAANYAKAHSTVANQMKGFCSSSLSSPIATTQRPESSEGTASKMHEIVSCGRSTLQPKQFLKPPDRVSMHSTNKTTGIDIGGLNDGRFLGSSNSNRPTNAMGFISKHQSGMTSNFLNQGRQQQNANDTAELMGLPSLICSQTGNSNNGNDTPRKLVPMFPSTVGENHSIAASAAAQAWMSLGASLENRPLVDSQRFPSSQVRSASDDTSAWRTLNTDPKNYDDSRVRNVSQFFRQPIQVVNAEPQVHHRGLVIFPQLIASDLSRSHGSSQWQGLVPHTQNKQKRDTLPPDLNISFQAPASPVGQSAGVHLDAQQPDLALQL